MRGVVIAAISVVALAGCSGNSGPTAAEDQMAIREAVRTFYAGARAGNGRTVCSVLSKRDKERMTGKGQSTFTCAEIYEFTNKPDRQYGKIRIKRVNVEGGTASVDVAGLRRRGRLNLSREGEAWKVRWVKGNPTPGISTP